jgi:hypothetical protein
MSIFKEYLSLKKAEHDEIVEATKPIREKYALLYKELQNKCTDHKWKWTGNNITNEVCFYSCTICGATKSEET